MSYRVKNFIASSLSFLLVPAILWGVLMVDDMWRVVRDFRVTTQVITDEGVVIEGTLDKQRNCRFIEAIAMLDEVPSEVLFLDLQEHQGVYTRTLGPQKWGPWLVKAKLGQGVRLHARHSCHIVTDHTEVLTSFVVGVQ